MPQRSDQPTDVMGAPPSRVQGWINEAAALTGLPTRLIQTIMYAESKYNPFPPDGPHDGSYEIGPMQLTAPLRRQMGISEAQARNPRLNTIYGAKHLKYLMDTYGGDFLRAATAYNGSGPAARAYGLNAMRLYQQQPSGQPSLSTGQPRRPPRAGPMISAPGGKPAPGTPLTSAQRDVALDRELALRAQGKFPGQQTEAEIMRRAPATAPTPSDGLTTPPPGDQATAPATSSAGLPLDRVWVVGPNGEHRSIPIANAAKFTRAFSGWKVDLDYRPTQTRTQGGGFHEPLFNTAAGWSQEPLSRAWEWANRGRYSPEQVLRAFGRPEYADPAFYEKAAAAQIPSQAGAANLQQQLLAHARANQGRGTPYTGPRLTSPDVPWFAPGMDRYLAGIVSGATSPAGAVSIGAGAGSRLLRLVPAGYGALSSVARNVGNVLRGAQTAENLVYGAKGAADVYGGLQRGIRGEGAEQVMSGISEMSGLPGAVQETRAATRGVAQRLLPTAGLYGEDALISALRPTPTAKMTPRVQRAWTNVGPEIRTGMRNQGDLEQFIDVAESVQDSALQNIDQALNQASPGSGFINPTQLIRSIKRRFLANIPGPHLNKQGRYIDEIAAYFDDPNRLPAIEADLRRNPMNIVRANKRVVKLGAGLIGYNSASPQQKRAMLAGADLEDAWMKAQKEAYEEQIDAKVARAGLGTGFYSQQRARFGDAKELATAARIRRADWLKGLGKENYSNRRILADFTAGLILGGGGFLAGGVPGALAGGAAGLGLAHGVGEFYSREAADPNRILRRAITPRPVPPRPHPFLNVIPPIASAQLQEAQEAENYERQNALSRLAQYLQRRQEEQIGIPGFPTGAGRRVPGNLVYPPPP